MIRITRALLPVALFVVSVSSLGEDLEAEDEVDYEVLEAELAVDGDGSIDDATSSILDAVQKRGFGARGDIRAGYFMSETDQRDGSKNDDDVLTARWRVEGSWNGTESWRLAARVAGLCSTDECDPNFTLNDNIPTSSGMRDGDITLDELFVHWFRSQRFDLAVGRLQTKFAARGGVFAKSLDRNDSHNVSVNWTDGMHGTIKTPSGWVSHLILQYNAEDGPTNIRRTPLDFTDDDSRISGFLAFENRFPKGPLLQRGFDVSYLPGALLKDGTLSGRREDYWGLVVRGAARWPQRSEGIRLRFAGEIGYAPETQTHQAANLPGSGDVDGWAWNVVVSLMDFAPSHSVGINYARTDPGWLLSPQYRPNDELFEIRYLWRRTPNLAIDVRARWRDEIDQQIGAVRKRSELDWWVRFTWGFSLLEI
ncbi:MAG: hypothetical protein ACR2QV_08890 [Gammaproteobacteria bacterium]